MDWGVRVRGFDGGCDLSAVGDVVAGGELDGGDGVGDVGFVGGDAGGGVRGVEVALMEMK